MSFPILLSTTEPFFMPGNRIGCLLVHGFTGTPKEMRWMGEYLNTQGYSVLGVRLSGHSTRIEDLIRCRWHDWLADLQDGWHILSGCSDQVYVMGLSLGGLLSLLFASAFPVAGVVAISTPHHLPNDPRLPLVKPLSVIWKYRRKAPEYWQDSTAREDHICYDHNPVRAISELRDMMREMQAALPRINAPVLLIYSRNDPSVKAEDQHAERMLEELGSLQKQVLWLNNGGHVITRDSDRHQAFSAICEFISQNSSIRE